MLLLAFLLGCAAREPLLEPDAVATTAIVGVDVITMVPGEELRRNQTVLVRGDRIAAVGDRRTVAVPRNATIIDGTGKTLMPGLVDAHVHLEYFDKPDILATFLKYGVTTVRNMDGRPYILEWKQKIARGELLGPTIYTAGPVLDGDPPARSDNTIVRNAAEARAEVFRQVDVGYDFIKVYTRLSPESYRAIIAAAQERRVRVAGHVPNRIELSEALGAQHAIEHLGDYADDVEAESSPFRSRWHWSKLYLAMPVDAGKMISTARQVAAARVWVVPTMVQSDRAVPDADSLQAWLQHTDMQVIPTDGREFWTALARKNIQRMDSADWQLVRAGYAHRRALVRAFHEAGARVAAGTDTPNPFVIPGAALHEELVALTESGFTPLDALAAATRNAAELLNASSEFGTVEVGKRADLLLLDANPLIDIRNTRRLAGIFARGRSIQSAR